MDNKELYNEIFEYWNTQYYSTALELSYQYLESKPDSIAVKIIQADIFITTCRFDQAKAILDCLLNASMSSEYRFQIFLHFGHYYKKKHQLEKSNAWYKQAMFFNQGNSSVLIYIAENYFSMGDYESSKRYFNKVITNNGDLLDEAFYNKGVIEKSLRNYDVALEYFEQALEIDPRYDIAIKQKIDTLKAQKKWADKPPTN